MEGSPHLVSLRVPHHAHNHAGKEKMFNKCLLIESKLRCYLPPSRKPEPGGNEIPRNTLKRTDDREPVFDDAPDPQGPCFSKAT